jgi:hypothetical protein
MPLTEAESRGGKKYRFFPSFPHAHPFTGLDRLAWGVSARLGHNHSELEAL